MGLFRIVRVGLKEVLIVVTFWSIWFSANRSTCGRERVCEVVLSHASAAGNCTRERCCNGPPSLSPALPPSPHSRNKESLQASRVKIVAKHSDSITRCVLRFEACQPHVTQPLPRGCLHSYKCVEYCMSGPFFLLKYVLVYLL